MDLTSHAPPARRWPATLLRIGLRVALPLLAAWGVLALAYRGPEPVVVRGVLVLAWSAACLAPLSSRAPRWSRWPAVVAILAMLAWWHSLTPSHDRDWSDDVARLLTAEIDGDRVVLHNVRDFQWRSEQDYDVRWETRTYDLDQLVSADLVLSYWMGPAIAHTLVSFGFADGRQLVFSLEIRKERGEAFSSIAGFFKEYETVIVAADEYDILRTRTNARGEDVYLYRLDLDQAQLRRAFLGYLQRTERIRRQPRFYNTLTSNCTTIVFELARSLDPGLPLDHRLLLSGWFAEYAFDHDGLVAGYDYPTLQARGRITERARAYEGPAAGFPAAIRRDVPGIPATDAP